MKKAVNLARLRAKVIEKLKQKGHEAIAAAPNTDVNTVTGEGLKEAMTGAGPLQVRLFPTAR